MLFVVVVVVCHPPRVKKREALTLLTLIRKCIFEEQIQNLKSRLREKGYSENLVQRTLSEQETGTPLKSKREQANLAFRYTTPPSSAKLKSNPHEDWHFYRATTIAQINLQRPACSVLNKQ